jgi:hypothetical protein
MSEIAKRAAVRHLAASEETIIVTLQKSSVGHQNRVQQTWRVDAPGKSTIVKTRTSDGDLEFLSKNDFIVEAFGKNVSAKSLIQHLIYSAPPNYYPLEGGTVELDKNFFDSL